MTHKSGVDGSTSRLARVLFTENSIIFSSCNIFQIEFCRRGSDRRGPWFCFSKESIRATHTPRTVIVQDVQSPLRPQQRFDRTALVHRAIALRHLIQRQCQVEYFSWIALPLPDQVDQLWEEMAHWRRTTVEVDVSEKQFLTVQFHSVRHADVPHMAAFTRSMDRLHHRFLGADALQHRVRTNSVGKLLYPVHTLITALRHDVSRAKLAGELLPRIATAHRDDPSCSHLTGGEHTKESHRAVTNDDDRVARLHIGCVRREPTGAHNIGEREETRNHVV